MSAAGYRERGTGSVGRAARSLACGTTAGSPGGLQPHTATRRVRPPGDCRNHQFRFSPGHAGLSRGTAPVQGAAATPPALQKRRHLPASRGPSTRAARGTAAARRTMCIQTRSWLWTSGPARHRTQENPAHKEPGGIYANYNAVPVRSLPVDRIMATSQLDTCTGRLGLAIDAPSSRQMSAPPTSAVPRRCSESRASRRRGSCARG